VDVKKDEDDGVNVSSLAILSHGIFQNQNDGISSQEHFGNEPILVDWLRLLLAFAGLWCFRPHFFDIFEDHVAVAVEGFDPAQQPSVVPTVDEDLSVVLDRVGEDGEGSGLELFLLSSLLLDVTSAFCAHVCVLSLILREPLPNKSVFFRLFFSGFLR